jgi:hypothetical protein
MNNRKGRGPMWAEGLFLAAAVCAVTGVLALTTSLTWDSRGWAGALTDGVTVFAALGIWPWVYRTTVGRFTAHVNGRKNNGC